MIPQYDRQQLEQFLAQEHAVLRECVAMLNRQIPLSDWPREVRMAFLLAIQAGEGREAYKAFSISRHLRITRNFSVEDIPASPTPLQRRCAERIRADLPRFVKLGAGTYL